MTVLRSFDACRQVMLFSKICKLHVLLLVQLQFSHAVRSKSSIDSDTIVCDLILKARGA